MNPLCVSETGKVCVKWRPFRVVKVRRNRPRWPLAKGFGMRARVYTRIVTVQFIYHSVYIYSKDEVLLPSRSAPAGPSEPSINIQLTQCGMCVRAFLPAERQSWANQPWNDMKTGGGTCQPHLIIGSPAVPLSSQRADGFTVVSGASHQSARLLLSFFLCYISFVSIYY